MYTNGEKYILHDDDIGGIEVFNKLLKKAITYNLGLHESITEDIGYLWNEYLQTELDQRKKRFVKKDNFWVGLNNFLWEIKGFDTWLYNKDNKIFLEITPTYKWDYEEIEHEEYVPYREFIKNYKTIDIL